LGVNDLLNCKLELKATQHWSCKSKIENSLSSMNRLISLIILSICSAILALIIQQSHFLIALLCLEGIILNIVLFVPLIMYNLALFVPSIRIIMLTFGACEASLGLSLIVKMSRSFGSDILLTSSTNKC
jgi:NADH-ubiquinone oxidoreductase chain 4L